MKVDCFLVGVLLVVVLFAGCASTPSGSQEAPVTPAAEVAPGAYAIPIDCAADFLACHEPTTAFAPDGTLLVATSPSESFYRIDAAGRVVQFDAPISASGYDSLLQTGPDGQVWFSRLVGGGVQVVHGNSYNWTEPMGLQPVPPYTIDRQWLAFSGAGTGWLVYNQVCSLGAGVSCGTELWAAPFTSGSFGEPRRIVGLEQRLEIGASGMPVLDARGRLFVPFFGQFSPVVSTPPGEGALSSRLVLVAVIDQESVTIETVHDAGMNDGVDLFWPTMAMEGGVPFIAWAQRTGGLYVSNREGEDWSDPVRVNDGREAARLPWALDTSAGRALVWYEASGGNPRVLDVVLTIGAEGPQVVGGPVNLGPEDTTSATLQNFPTTDFAHAAATPTRLAVPWYDRDTGLHVSVVPLPGHIT